MSKSFWANIFCCLLLVASGSASSIAGSSKAGRVQQAQQLVINQPVGLVNLGRTCFLNAQIQLLFANRELVNRVLAYSPVVTEELANTRPFQFAILLKKFFARMVVAAQLNQQHREVLAENKIYANYLDLDDEFRRLIDAERDKSMKNLEDASEVLALFLDNLPPELTESLAVEIQHIRKVPGRPGQGVWSSFPLYRCEGTLAKCLAMNTEMEAQIRNTSNYLLFNVFRALKKGKMVGDRYKPKLKSVSYPAELDMGLFTRRATDQPVKKVMYDLIGIIYHAPDHYYSFIKNQATGAWYNANDRTVTEEPVDKVMNHKMHSETLMYQRRRDSALPNSVDIPLDVVNASIQGVGFGLTGTGKNFSYVDILKDLQAFGADITDDSVAAARRNVTRPKTEAVKESQVEQSSSGDDDEEILENLRKEFQEEFKAEKQQLELFAAGVPAKETRNGSSSESSSDEEPSEPADKRPEIKLSEFFPRKKGKETRKRSRDEEMSDDDWESWPSDFDERKPPSKKPKTEASKPAQAAPTKPAEISDEDLAAMLADQTAEEQDRIWASLTTVPPPPVLADRKTGKRKAEKDEPIERESSSDTFFSKPPLSATPQPISYKKPRETAPTNTVVEKKKEVERRKETPEEKRAKFDQLMKSYEKIVKEEKKAGKKK